VSGDPEPENLSLSEIFERYRDRWVAIEVTKRDGNLQPIEGRVVEAEVDRYTLAEKTTKLEDVCILYAGDLAFRILV
jgi:hypothetical protein